VSEILFHKVDGSELITKVPSGKCVLTGVGQKGPVENPLAW